MSREPPTLPSSRSWRDIPQEVKPRAMSREGRRRVVMRTLRMAAGLAVLAVGVWVIWAVTAALREDSSAMPAAAKAYPVRPPVLTTDGVLDNAWLARTLALRKRVTLMELDLNQLKGRILADGQVGSASISKNFPDVLKVRIAERSPVARLMAQIGSEPPRPLLVARDGVAYVGKNYDAGMIASLPWLDGVKLARGGTGTGSGLAPIEGMETVSALLGAAKLDAEHLYRTWQVVSLARMAADNEIEIRTRTGLKVIFGLNEDFLRQLGRLDLVIESAGGDPTRPLREVNLANGAQVAATLAPPVLAGLSSPGGASGYRAAGPNAARPRISLSLPAFPSGAAQSP